MICASSRTAVRLECDHTVRVCVLPGGQGSAQRCTAVGEDVAVAVGVVVVLPPFGRPRAFDLERGGRGGAIVTVRGRQINEIFFDLI